MATSNYFNNFGASTEQTLVEDLIIESIKIHGVDLYYIKRTRTGTDDLLNEDDVSKFTSAFLIDMYIKSVDGFDGEGDFLSKFGLQIRDSITFTTAIRTFNLEVGLHTGQGRPEEGDLIYFPFNNKVFEIMHVEHEAVFYQMGALQTYDLKCELFEYSGERFETGVPLVDRLFDDYDMNSNTAVANVESISAFADNDIIEQEADAILDFSESNPFGEDQF